MATILIAEGDLKVREFAAHALKQHGHSVITAVDGPGALYMLGSNQVDLLLCDIDLNAMDGFALAMQAPTFNPKIKTLLVTRRIADPRTKMDIANFADGALEKPFTVARLYRAVDNQLKPSS